MTRFKYDIETEELRSESDIENKLIIPLLEELGFDRDEIHSQNTLSVRVGSQDRNLQYDTVAHIDDRPVFVIDEKAPFQGIESDIMQAESYAKLISTPPAPFAAVTDGARWEIKNVITGESIDELPTREDCQEEILTGVKELPEEEKEQAKRIAFTSTEKLIDAFQNCNDPLEQPEGLSPESRFEEMAKILLTKMSEDARANEGHEHRFTWDYVEEQKEKTGFSALEVVNQFLFSDAKSRYTDVFSKNTTINIRYESTIETIIKELEDYYLAGTGEDIKGPAYEIFLKEQLRQGLGKYFTPREIVFFTVELLGLNIGDNVIDPAAGSGGFLAKSFTSLKSIIETSNLSEDDREKYLEDLRQDGVWGTEITPSLAELCKMNLIVHGDGHNHVYHLDGLTGEDEEGNQIIPENEFENVVTNPPFNKPIEADEILTRFEVGTGDSTGSDELFVERCMQLAKEGGTIAIVLPYGFLNLPSHEKLRQYLYQNCNLEAIISLPVGAFQPVGASNSRTCVMVLEKATEKETKDPDNKVFLAEAEHIGYVPGEKEYKETERNDLPTIAQEYHDFKQSPEEGLITENPPIAAESQEKITSEDRGDPSYYISQYTDYEGNEKRIGDIAEISQPKMNPSIEKPDEEFLHLSVRDLNESTGGVRSLNRKLGSDIKKSQTFFEGEQILLTRIRPSLDNKKVSIIPDSITQGVGSGEFLVVEAKEDFNPYYLLQALRTDYAIGQLVSKATGSTGRQRIRVEDVLEIKIPWPEEEMREKIAERTEEGLDLIIEGKNLIDQADL
jgi:type I restriction enzyme M protein